MSKTSRPSARRAQQPLGGREQSGVETTCIGLALFVSGLLFLRSGTDAFSLPRATAFVAIAVFLVGHWVTLAMQDRLRISVERVFLMTGGVVVVLLLGGWLTSPLGWTAALGVPNRAIGLVEYLSYAVLFVAATRLDRSSWRVLVHLMLILATLVAAYGVLQWLGADPLDWPKADLSTIFSTFGQTNFAAGWAAISLPIALAVALDGRGNPPSTPNSSGTLCGASAVKYE